MKMSNRNFLLGTVGTLALAAGASAQIAVTAQLREITGHSLSTDPSGTIDSGPLSTSAPDGDFGNWAGSLVVPGFISGQQAQIGGFNGTDTITLDSFGLNLGGGNGPGTSADSSATNTFSYTFNIATATNFELNVNTSCAGPGGPPNTTVEFSVTVSLDGPSGNVFELRTGPDNGFSIMVSGLTGTLPSGSYTLAVVGNGHVAFLAPLDGQGNGAGGGAGGPQPIMVFMVGGSTGCAADFNGDGERNPDDLADFITCFFLDVQFPGTCAEADFNDDTFRDPDDLADFITIFFLGC